MVNQVASFITSIQNLSGEETVKELVDFCKKWLDDSAEKLSVVDFDRILNSLTPVKYSAGYICALAAKLPKLRTDDAGFIEFSARLNENLLSMNDVQIHWIQDIYTRFFHSLADEFIKRDLAIYGCRIMADAIIKLTGGFTTLLTNIHSALFCLCLKARRFDVAMPFFQLNVTELFLSAPASFNTELANASAIQDPTTSNVQGDPNPADGMTTNSAVDCAPILPTEQKIRKINLDTRHVLSYFYYGAMIFATMKRWDEALRMLEHCICLPCSRLSAVIVEAFKKYILISLLAGRFKPLQSLPSYKSPIIQRHCAPLCNTYLRLAELVQKHSEKRGDVADVIENYLSQKEEVFRRDENCGLVKQLVIAAKENAIKRLGTVFISLHLNEVSRLAHVSNAETEEIVRRLCHHNDYNVKIDQKTKTFRFDLESNTETESSSNPANEIDKNDVETALREVIALRGLISEYETAVRLHPAYVLKNGTLKGSGNVVSSSFGSMLYQEDEGFQITGSPPIS